MPGERLARPDGSVDRFVLKFTIATGGGFSFKAGGQLAEAITNARAQWLN
jgi:hypothetical protein